MLKIDQHFISQRAHYIAALFHLVMQINQFGQPFGVLRQLLDHRLHTLGKDARLLLKTAADTAVILYTAT